jgi:uncharacterized protein (TIGR02145 family)
MYLNLTPLNLFKMKNSLFKFAVLSVVTILSFSCSSEKEIAKTVPQLSTNNATNITLTTATSGGNITADGGEAVTARGLVWSTATAPTTSLSTKTNDGTGTGTFTSSITNLTPSTNYYARAYATNSVGTGYGNEITFTTGAVVLPTLTTTIVSGITTNSAISGGAITNDGGAAITARGIVWSTTQNPTIALSTKTTDGSGTGTFSTTIAGLSPNTTYYLKAYATNNAGTAYGSQLSFTTLSPNYAAMYPTGTVFCNNVVTAVVDVTNPVTGKTWMDRNLGASQVATSSTDALAYGDLYQWGRRADGHQCRNSGTTTTLSTTDQPNHGNFIINPEMWKTADWRSPHNPNLWQGINGVNNPCPTGYRIPTSPEWNDEIQSWSTKNTIGAFNSKLKLPLAAIRFSNNASIINTDTGMYYTSSHQNDMISIRGVLINSLNGTANGFTGSPAVALSVRCIKN